MTWHQLFDLRTIEHRHIVCAFSVVVLMQGGYFLAIANSWLRMRHAAR